MVLHALREWKLVREKQFVRLRREEDNKKSRLSVLPMQRLAFLKNCISYLWSKSQSNRGGLQ